MSSAQPLLRSRWIAGLGLTLVVALFWLYRILLSGTDVGLLRSDVFLYYLPIYETLYGQPLVRRSAWPSRRMQDAWHLLQLL